MSRFLLFPQANLDLIEIWEYIALDSMDAADRVYDELYAAFKRPADMPPAWVTCGRM